MPIELAEDTEPASLRASPVNQYRRVMVDLETGGTRAGCAVFSIGACFFSSTAPVWKGPVFYAVASRESNKKYGLFEQEDTMTWWAKQASDARALMSVIEHPSCFGLDSALSQFTTWLKESADINTVQLWGNGADFDNPILTAAYHAAGLQPPWSPFGGRCYRTLKGLRPGVKMHRTGTHHNALDDACSQAEHAVRLLREINA